MSSATAEVKKKLPDESVVKPVAITNSLPMPKPAQLPVQEPAPVKESTSEPLGSPVSKPVPDLTPEPPNPTTEKKGWGKISSSMNVPNLNTIFEDKPEEDTDEPDLVQGNAYREVTFNVFLAKWNAFADTLKQTKRITLYTIMTANVPRLKGTLIEVDVENGVQMDELKLGKIDVLNYLRVELQNFSLDLIGIQVEVTKVRKPYTSVEKYQAMVSKNPALETLRKAFNLGLS